MAISDAGSSRIFALSQDVFYLPRGGGDHVPYADQLVAVYSSFAHVLAEELAEIHDVVPDLMQLGCDLGVPTSSEPAPYIPDGALVLLEELTPLIGDGVNFLAVPLGGTHVTHVFEQLQCGVDGPRTRGVEPAGPLLQLPYDLVAVGGLVLEQVEHHVLEIPLLEHPPPPRAVAEPMPVPAPEEPPHRFWTEHVLYLLLRTLFRDTKLLPSTGAGRAPRASRPTFPRAPSLPRDRSPPDPRASCQPRRR